MRARTAGLSVASVVLAGCGGHHGDGVVPGAAPPAVTSSSGAPGSETSPTSQQAARQLVRSPRAVSFDSAVDGHGDLVTVWSKSFESNGPTVVATRTLGGRTTLRFAHRTSGVEASLRRGWLVDSQPPAVVHPDGSVTVAATSGLTRAVLPGDRFLFGHRGGPALFRPSEDTVHRLPDTLGPHGGTPVMITADGDLLTEFTLRGAAEVGRFDGRTWTTTPIDSGPGATVGGAVYGDGRHLVTFSTYVPVVLGDDAEPPVHDVAVSQDGGRTWRSVRAPIGESVVLSGTVTTGGTAFLTIGSPHGSCSLLRVTPGGPASCVPAVPAVQVFSRGDRVFAADLPPTGSYRLVTSSDRGRHWRPVAAPGRE